MAVPDRGLGLGQETYSSVGLGLKSQRLSSASVQFDKIPRN